MGRVILLLSITLLPCGCKWLQSIGPAPDVTPVMNAPPPRMRDDNLALNNRDPIGRLQARSQSNEPITKVQLASALRNGNPDSQLVGAQVVATVDGAPILASDILDRYSPKLESVRRKATPSQMRTVRARLIKRDLQTHIERQLLINALKAEFPRKALVKLDEAITAAFDEKIEEMKKQSKSRSKAELQTKLAEHGLSLASQRDKFANQQMAAFYFQSKAKKKTIIGRREMMSYYEQHLDEYAIPARARWQEIQISFRKHGGRDAALKVLEEVHSDLRERRDFGEVAKTYSDGTSAKRGGVWDWTVSGSLTNEKIDNAIFQLPVGQISQVFESENDFRVIKVVQRENARWKPFEKLQDEIREKLKVEARKQAANKLLDDLMAKATIVTMFDDEKDYSPRWRELTAGR